MSAQDPDPPHHEPQIHCERYQLTSKHDLVLVVKENWIDKVWVDDELVEEQGELRAVYEFEVSRDVLIAIPYFKRLLTQGFRESKQDVVELKEDDPRAWKLWLEILHRSLERSSYDAQIITVWHVLRIAEKYGISPTRKDAQEWFDRWFVKQSGDGLFTENESICEVLFPCHAFDHALGFSTSTMWLAYHSAGHIVEQQLNAARGRLKTILHRGLYDTVDILLEHASCSLRKDALWEYFTALNKTKSWPLERYAAKKSIRQLLQNLESFEYHDPHPGQDCIDYSCGQDFKRVVDDAIKQTDKLFDGLCLNCMNSSRRGDEDKDYWEHDDQNVDWSEGCRMTHGEPTHFYSIMRRREKRILYT